MGDVEGETLVGIIASSDARSNCRKRNAGSVAYANTRCTIYPAATPLSLRREQYKQLALSVSQLPAVTRRPLTFLWIAAALSVCVSSRFFPPSGLLNINANAAPIYYSRASYRNRRDRILRGRDSTRRGIKKEGEKKDKGKRREKGPEREERVRPKSVHEFRPLYIIARRVTTRR